MTLYESMMETYVFMNKKHVSDGEGGLVTSWEDGAEFKAVAVQDTSTLAKVAEHEGVTSTYTVTTNRNMQLEFHDVIKRKSDGFILRITSDGDSKESPESSPVIDIVQVSAERWSLPQ